MTCPPPLLVQSSVVSTAQHTATQLVDVVLGSPAEVSLASSLGPSLLLEEELGILVLSLVLPLNRVLFPNSGPNLSKSGPVLS